mmetsp:Transcript_92600/g.163805  ORF Transcript_92600/g.163805 Transcript_92600/m.163805 type:complete len:459 (+) Transcript_92600:3-1379(+)
MLRGQADPIPIKNLVDFISNKQADMAASPVKDGTRRGEDAHTVNKNTSMEEAENVDVCSGIRPAASPEITTWFAKLFGFVEGHRSFEEVQAAFAVDGSTLYCKENRQSYNIGDFSCPTLAELRSLATALSDGSELRVRHTVTNNVAEDHIAPENKGALIQAASQFNCLEMTDASVSPEAGITGVMADATQGPACAVATAPALLYRNYLISVHDGRLGTKKPEGRGQTARMQLNNCRDLEELLLRKTGQQFWEVRNGYLRSDSARLQRLSAWLDDEKLRGELKEQLRIGVTWNAQVVSMGSAPGQCVSQAWCSAVPAGSIGEKCEGVAPCTHRDWEPLARLVLEATYEATLLAAIVNRGITGSRKVLLCMVGSGVFFNRTEWIVDAINAALRSLASTGLGCDVYLNHYQRIDAAIEQAIGIAAPHRMEVSEWSHNCGGGMLALSMKYSSCKWCGAQRPP